MSESGKITVSIYDFPPKLKEKLEKEAQDNRRSLGQHIIYLLEKKEKSNDKT